VATYYIRLKVADEVPNLSPLSNEAIGTTGAGVWSRDVVAVLEPGSHMNDLEFDPRDGHPSIAFIGYNPFNSGYDLKLAHWNGNAWTTEVINSLAAANNGIDLVFEPGTGFPTLSYSASGQVKFARWNGASWILETVEASNAGGWTALAYDAAGHPSVAYHRTSGSRNRTVVELMFAVKVGAAWSRETVVTGGRSDFNKAMAYDPSGNPTIAYVESVYTQNGAFLYHQLNFARKSGTGWTIELVPKDPLDNFGLGLDMEYDPLTGQPAISHKGGPSCDQYRVFFSRRVGINQWNTEVIEGPLGVCGSGGTSLEFDAWGVPHVAFGLDTLPRIKLARWNGLAWEIELLGCSSQVEVCRGALEIDSLGRPALSHRVGGELWYSVRNAP